MRSSPLHMVSAQHVAPSSHSSSDPPGHHIGLVSPSSVQLADASAQDVPQKRKFCGRSYTTGDNVGRSESIVGLAVYVVGIDVSMSTMLQVTPGQQYPPPHSVCSPD